MAVRVSKDRPDSDDKPKKFKAPKTGGLDLSLPTEATDPITDLGGIMILIHGERKIGKTSLATMFGKTMLLAFEVGYKGLRVFARDVPDWDHARGYLRLLRKDKSYKTVVIDTADIAYALCDLWVCKKNGIDDIAEMEWGKGWRALRKEFETFLTDLVKTGKGVIILSHSQEREVKTRSGETYDRIMPTMAKAAREIIEGMADLMAYYQYDGERRILTIEGDDHITAGHRFEERFRTPDGQRIRHIDMGSSRQEAYKNFVAAWTNKYEPEDEDDLVQDEEEAPTKKGKKKFKLKKAS